MARDDTGRDSGPEEPLSSEELLRRAREGLSTPTPQEAESESEAMVDAAEAAAESEAPESITRYPDDPEPSSWQRTTPAPKPFDDGEADDPFSTASPASSRDTDRVPTVTDRMTTPPPQAPPSPQSPMSRIWQSRGILIALVIIGLIVFRFFDNTTSVDDLTTGDCFNEPSAFEFDSVDVVDCDEAHDYEVLALVNLTGATYPGDFEVTIQAFEQCEVYFEAYVGVPFDVSEVYIAPFVPAESSWEDGEREAICGLYLLSSDQESVARTSGSLLGSGR